MQAAYVVLLFILVILIIVIIWQIISPIKSVGGIENEFADKTDEYLLKKLLTYGRLIFDEAEDGGSNPEFEYYFANTYMELQYRNNIYDVIGYL